MSEIDKKELLYVLELGRENALELHNYYIECGNIRRSKLYNEDMERTDLVIKKIENE